MDTSVKKHITDSLFAVYKKCNGLIGVPITIFDKHCSEQFQILGITCRGYSPEYRTKLYSMTEYKNANDLNGSGCILINEIPKMIYGRILIRRIKK